MNIIVAPPQANAAAAAAAAAPPPPQAVDAEVVPPPPQAAVAVAPPPPQAVAVQPNQEVAVIEAVDCEVCGHRRAEKHGCGRAQVAAAKAEKARSKKLRSHNRTKMKKW